LTVKRGGIVAKIKEVAPDAKFVHRSIHREALATRKTPAILKTALIEAVKVVNFTKSKATNSRLFSILCNEMASEYDKLLHTEVRWLSRGNVLSHLLELRSEVQIFLSDTVSDLSNCFSDEMWLSQLAYMPGIFCRISEFHKSLQGFHVTPFSVHDKKNFKKKILVSLSKKQKMD
jgi:hypothetical protein